MFWLILTALKWNFSVHHLTMVKRKNSRKFWHKWKKEKEGKQGKKFWEEKQGKNIKLFSEGKKIIRNFFFLLYKKNLEKSHLKPFIKTPNHKKKFKIFLFYQCIFLETYNFLHIYENIKIVKFNQIKFWI